MNRLIIPFVTATISALEFGCAVFALLSKTGSNKQIFVALFTALGVLFFLSSVILTIAIFCGKEEDDEENKTEN